MNINHNLRHLNLQSTHLLDLCRACLENEGMAVPSGRLELVRASMSTYSLPTALGNVANKLLLDAYNDSLATCGPSVPSGRWPISKRTRRCVPASRAAWSRLRRAVSLEVEPRLSNAGKFGDKASPDHWYLFAAPSAAPMVSAFLNGKQEPTTEFFGLDQTVDRLAVSWRVYHDFGVAFCDPRAAVQVVGE